MRTRARINPLIGIFFLLLSTLLQNVPAFHVESSLVHTRISDYTASSRGRPRLPPPLFASPASESSQNNEFKSETTTANDAYTEQRKLFESLDSSFDYEGRVQSSHQGNNNTSNNKNSIDYNQFHSGYVSVIGAANMGKSTLVNSLLEESLCIATRRPQTTRHAILGILTTNACQLCLLDTPGIIETPAYKLQEGMMEAVQGALKDADVLLVVTDIFSTPIPNDELFARVQKLHAFKPTIVVINKTDLQPHKVNSNSDATDKTSDQNSDDDDDDDNNYYTAAEDGDERLEKTATIPDAVSRWRQYLPDALAILPISAVDGPTNPGVVLLRRILLGGPDVAAAIRDLGRPIPGMFRPGVAFIGDDEARALLPLGPPLYDEDMYTDRSERFLASEMIRAALLETFKKELPYCCEVQVTSFKEQPKGSLNPKLIKIEANIFVERDSQKVIVIGKQGSKIKEVGILARTSLEHFFQTKVYLALQVKVDKDWRKKDDKLKKFGYLK